jgi:hypothetical protein
VTGTSYSCASGGFNDRTGLVQRVQRVLADRWPAFDFEFQADTGGNITDIR